MRYVIADIHGCYKQYIELIEQIGLTDEDDLYILGDAMDRGPEPIKVIQDIMDRPNATYILGNHDFMMWKVAKDLMVEITEDNAESYLTQEHMQSWLDWMENGGGNTLEQFRKLSRKEQQGILDYIEEASGYEVIDIGYYQYILVHAGIANFDERKMIEDYDLPNLIFYRPDFSQRLYKNDLYTHIIVGHTPTITIHDDKRPEIYKENGYIAIDCGCVFGGRLAAYCIDTGETVYSEL